MSRLARMVVPGLPHHVTQRGNRREAIFFEDGDQQLYCEMLAEQLRRFSVEVWAYCLMPNHVHLILTPQGADGMSRALGEAHRRYTNLINARGRWTGDLFQSRFGRGLCLVPRNGRGRVCEHTLPVRMTAWCLCVRCSTAGRVLGICC
jgi:putative transposase